MGQITVNERRYYTYDNLNRLVSTFVNDYITNTSGSTTYTYDKVGNRTKIEDYATATEYVYNELNQLVLSETYNKSPRTTTSDVTYTYDASGNLVSESD